LSTGELQVDDFIHFDSKAGTFFVGDKSKENSGKKTLAMLDGIKTIKDKIKPEIAKSAFDVVSNTEKPLGNEFVSSLSKEV
jgi:hypothetical protein